jgi:hypothetical protein
MGQVAWKSAHAVGTSWTIKGVQEPTRDAVRDAAAEAGMLIGDWVDQALAKAAREALHPSPPLATRDDVAAIVAELAKLRAGVRMLAEAKASAQDLAEVQARVEKLAERTTGYDRPAVRHVMVEHKRPARLASRPDGKDKSSSG